MASHTPRPRLVALGASNLTRGLLALADVARGRAQGPVEIVAALGRGRSFGIRSRIFGRTLSGIDDCGLWPALATGPGRTGPGRTGTALVMDVGNDILYGVEVATILAWVARALERLDERVGLRIVAGLPLENLERLDERRFLCARTLLVPGCRLSLADVRERAEELERRLRELAAGQGAVFRPLRAGWYGLDPMHFARRHQPAVFAELLGASAMPPAERLDGHAGRLRFLLAAPERSWWWGLERRGAQPARRWPDGTTVTLY